MANRLPPPAESTRLPLRDQRARPRPDDDESNADEEEEAEAEKLEEEVKEMAQKLSTYRSTFPDQLRSGLDAVLSAQRPQFPISESGSTTDLDHDAGSHGESSEGAVAAVEDKVTADRIRLLKEKISSNISSMPLVLKRMNECISRIDKLNSCSDIIHPAFKRKKS